MMVARKQTLVQLSEEQVVALDRRAQRDGVSRSQLIRRAVDAFLADDEEARIDAAIIEGYRRIPPGTPDEWGDLGASLDHHTRETMQRLDEEERQAGVEPW
jgi:Arc/MetJ-type ribon-helix-helix transcriptional regulator